ncbi:molecular chaperone [Pseudomonas sp. URMO17WK12:I12]|jgi:fimbrial chaperone protein|uniref:fimbrial biogenesis chaperone n=1 Tax=Pseudomonas sp. URMO17WK12:I12 TaxID=1259797 RepID=UPI0004843B64|nr:molecular chaperone [Pseudomonas sp. URMO17WK12:I12]
MRKLACLLFCLSGLGPLLAQADVQLGATRVIFAEGKREAGLRVRDRTTGSPPHLIQSWITDAAERETDLLTVVPPLFRLDSGVSRTLRIIKAPGALAKDRETLFWLNVKVIPPSEKDAEDVLKTVVVFQLKLICRPAALKPEQAAKAYRSLAFDRGTMGQLKVNNPTPFYVSLAYLKVNGVDIPEAALLAPHETASYPIAATEPRKVAWVAVDDFGVMTEEASFSF